MKIRILLDLDGVIANFYNGFATFLNEHYGCTLDPAQDPKKYDFDQWGHGVDQIDFDAASLDWMKNNGFKKLPCYVGAEQFVKQLMNSYNIYIVTARVGDWQNKLKKDIKNIIKQDTYSWLENKNIPTNKLYFVHDKVSFCKQYGISIMIEDKLETALKAAKEKIYTILINRGYNQSKTERLRIYRAFDFDHALDQLKKLT